MPGVQPHDIQEVETQQQAKMRRVQHTRNAQGVEMAMKVTITDILFFVLFLAFAFLAAYTYGLEKSIEEVDYENQLCQKEIYDLKHPEDEFMQKKTEGFKFSLPNLTK